MFKRENILTCTFCILRRTFCSSLPRVRFMFTPHRLAYTSSSGRWLTREIPIPLYKLKLTCKRVCFSIFSLEDVLLIRFCLFLRSSLLTACLRSFCDSDLCCLWNCTYLKCSIYIFNKQIQTDFNLNCVKILNIKKNDVIS